MLDTDEGRQEILCRRIGRNELDTIQSCLAIVDAENEYADKDHGVGVGAYAQRIVSTPGKQDGRIGSPTAMTARLARSAMSSGGKMIGGFALVA